MMVRLSALRADRPLPPGDPRAIVRLEGLDKLKKIHVMGTRTRDLPACSFRKIKTICRLRHDRPVLSSERAPHIEKRNGNYFTVTKIWSWAPEGVWYQGWLAGPNVNLTSTCLDYMVLMMICFKEIRSACRESEVHSPLHVADWCIIKPELTQTSDLMSPRATV
jgi:hypothetical protein